MFAGSPMCERDLREFQIPLGVAVFGGIGRIDPQKGWMDLLTALATLQRSRPLVRHLRVFLLGSGPQESELRESITQFDLSQVITLVGWQPQPAEWLAAADGLVLPSHWEGMPNVVLEAFAAGKPVIATDVEGVRDLVEPGASGWISPPRSTGAAGRLPIFWTIPRPFALYTPSPPGCNDFTFRTNGGTIRAALLVASPTIVICESDRHSRTRRSKPSFRRI